MQGNESIPSYIVYCQAVGGKDSEPHQLDKHDSVNVQPPTATER